MPKESQNYKTLIWGAKAQNKIQFRKLKAWVTRQFEPGLSTQTTIHNFSVYSSEDLSVVVVIDCDSIPDAIPAVPPEYGVEKVHYKKFAENYSTGPVCDLPSFIGWKEALLQVTRSVHQNLSIAIEKLDLPIRRNEFVVLQLVSLNPGIDHSTLVESSWIDKATMTFSINELKKQQLVTQEIGTPDRRRRVLYLTKEGEVLYKKLLPRVTGLVNEVADMLPPAKIRTLVDLLATLNYQLREFNQSHRDDVISD